MRLRVHRSAYDPDTLLLDCQSELYASLKSRFVIPLVEVDSAPRPLPKINPILLFGGRRYVLLTDHAANMPAAELGEVLGSLAGEHITISRAFDALLSGY